MARGEEKAAGWRRPRKTGILREGTWRTLTAVNPYGLRIYAQPLPALPGVWRVEWWDTRGKLLIHRETLDAKENNLNLIVIDFDRVIAAGPTCEW